MRRPSHRLNRRGTGIINSRPVTAESLLGQATWQLWGDDALDSAGTLTSWPAQSGPNAILLSAPFIAPTVTTVAARNNKKAVVFAKGTGTALDVDGTVSSTAGDHTLLFFCDPDAPSHESASAAREYLICCNYNSAGRLDFAHNANDQRNANAYRNLGFFNAAVDGDDTPNAGWHNYIRQDNGNPYAKSIAGPQCRVDVLQSGVSGISVHYRDGVEIGRTTGKYQTTRAFGKGSGAHRIGIETTATLATDPTAYGGKIYCILYWNRALSESEAQLISAYVMDYYSWTARSYILPNERAGITSWYSSGKNVAAGTAIPTTAPTWPDLMATMSFSFGALTVTDGAADFVPNQDLNRGSAMSNWVSASAYTVYQVFWVDDASTTSTTTNANDVTCCDNAGRWGLHFRDTGSSTYEVRGYHTDGAAKTVTVTGLTENSAWHLAIWRYDGSTDTLYLQIDGGAVQSTSSVGDIVLLTGTIAFGGRPADTTVQFDGKVREFAVFNTFHDNTTVAQMRTFFEAMRDAA